MSPSERSDCRSLCAAAALVALLALSAGCSKAPGEPNEGAQPPFVEAGDLPEIQKSGTLRVLLPIRAHPAPLPRGGAPLDQERRLVERYAQRNGLEPFWVYVHSREELIPSLLEGKGDLIAANLTMTEERKRQVAFTVPVSFVREQLVARLDDAVVRDVEDLRGRTVAVRPSSSFWSTLVRMHDAHPVFDLERVPEDLSTEGIVHRVAKGEIDLTAADSNLMEEILRYREDVRVAFDLTEDRPIGWAVRPGSRSLLRSLDNFLTEAHLVRPRQPSFVGDLPEIRERRVLRLLTRNSPSTYFLWRGQLMGFEYEMARRFAEQQGLRLEVVVLESPDDLLPSLVEGDGDLVAAALTPTETALVSVAFSRPYNRVTQVVVARKHDAALLGQPEALAGHTFYVAPGGAHEVALKRLQRRGIAFDIAPTPAAFGSEEIIELVAEGTYDLTVADSHVLDIELTWRDDVEAALPLGNPVPLRWAVRADNPELRDAVDEFLAGEYRGLFYNVIYDKYFRDPKRMRRHVEQRVAESGVLSPYDNTVRRYARRHGFDWRLVTALMYQESRFDPDARSFAGALGLLQVLPTTARQVDVDVDLHDPEGNIRAGVRYLAWLRDTFDEELSVQDRTWFTLAAYNVGLGHVLDARRLASEQGRDPDRWFGNVEQAMILLSRPEYASHAPHGYCRGSEPVRYVREIYARYNAYLEALDKARSRDAARPVALR